MTRVHNDVSPSRVLQWTDLHVQICMHLLRHLTAFLLEDDISGLSFDHIFSEPEIRHSSSSTEVVSESASGQRKRSCLVLEIFAGSCRLSRACRRAGLRATAVDQDPTRAEIFSIYQCI